MVFSYSSHKTNLNKLKRVEILQSMFSDHNVMKLESNSRTKIGKLTNNVEIKQYSPIQPMDQRRDQKGNQKIL